MFQTASRSGELFIAVGVAKKRAMPDKLRGMLLFTSSKLDNVYEEKSRETERVRTDTHMKECKNNRMMLRTCSRTALTAVGEKLAVHLSLGESFFSSLRISYDLGS